MQVLSEEQALQDFAMVVHSLRTTLPKGWESPFITVGGSLAGEISTWLRVRYPVRFGLQHTVAA
jgi:hypothetical protein